MLSLEYISNGGLKAWFIDPLCGWGRIKRIVWNVCSLNERNICYFVTVFLFSWWRKAGLSQNKQVIDICTSPTALTSSFYYNTDDIIRLSASSLTTTVAKKHCTSIEFYIWFTWENKWGHVLCSNWSKNYITFYYEVPACFIYTQYCVSHLLTCFIRLSSNKMICKILSYIHNIT